MPSKYVEADVPHDDPAAQRTSGGARDGGAHVVSAARVSRSTCRRLSPPSTKWTCASTNPGATKRPSRSTVRAACQRVGIAPSPTSAIFPESTTNQLAST
jgi:hypothetical protein